MATTKELSELIAGIEVLALTSKQVLKDGKVDLTDLPAVVDLAAKVGVLVKAIEGIKEIPAEVKDVDAAEAIALVEAMYSLVNKVKAA